MNEKRTDDLQTTHLLRLEVDASNDGVDALMRDLALRSGNRVSAGTYIGRLLITVDLDFGDAAVVEASVEAILAAHASLRATATIVPPNSERLQVGIFRDGRRVSSWAFFQETTAAHSVVAVSGAEMELKRFALRSVAPTADDVELLSWRERERMRVPGCDALILAHRHIDLKRAQYDHLWLSERFPALNFRVAILPFDDDLAGVVATVVAGSVLGDWSADSCGLDA